MIGQRYKVLLVRICPVCMGKFRHRKYIAIHRMTCGADFVIEHYGDAVSEI